MFDKWHWTDFRKNDADNRVSYRLNIEKSFIAILVFFNVAFFITPEVKLAREVENPPEIVITVENIPLTRQAQVKPPPPKPTVPIPSDDESIPEDVTIEVTDLPDIFFDDGVPDFTGLRITPPKPIAWRFPEYPEDEKKKGVHGIVKLSLHIDNTGKVIEVIVLDNTTNSSKCAEAAVEAAYGSRFFPAKENGEAVDTWISQPFRFDVKN